MVMMLAAGLALFLYSMRTLTEALKTLPGARMKNAREIEPARAARNGALG